MPLMRLNARSLCGTAGVYMSARKGVTSDDDLEAQKARYQYPTAAEAKASLLSRSAMCEIPIARCVQVELPAGRLSPASPVGNKVAA